VRQLPRPLSQQVNRELTTHAAGALVPAAFFFMRALFEDPEGRSVASQRDDETTGLAVAATA